MDRADKTGRAYRKGFLMIRHATIWAIWKERNDRMFNGVSKEVEEIVVVDAIKVLSWIWSLNRLKIRAFMFYEWCWNQRDVLSREGRR